MGIVIVGLRSSHRLRHCKRIAIVVDGLLQWLFHDGQECLRFDERGASLLILSALVPILITNSKKKLTICNRFSIIQILRTVKSVWAALSSVRENYSKDHCSTPVFSYNLSSLYALSGLSQNYCKMHNFIYVVVSS